MLRHEDEQSRFEALSAYRDGELSPQEESEVRAHLETCEQCRKDLEAMERTAKFLYSPEREIPKEAEAAWKQAVHRERNRRRIGAWLRPAAAVAAALVLVFAGSALLKNNAVAPAPAQQEAAAEEGRARVRAEEPQLFSAELDGEAGEPAEPMEGEPQIAAFSLEDAPAAVVDAPESAACIVRVLPPEGKDAAAVYAVTEGYVAGCGLGFSYEEQDGAYGLLCDLTDAQKEGLFDALTAMGCTVEPGEGAGAVLVAVSERNK